MAVIPKITKIFIMLLPTTLPNVIADLPFNADIMFTTSSGAEVPKATIVSPITIFGILNLLAITEAPSTREFAPKTKKMTPTSKITKDSINPPRLNF